MNYQELSPQGEHLLKEILDMKNRQEDNSEHWNKRFDALSCNEDDILRSTFKELKDCGYIATQWADDIPYILSVTVDGTNYFQNKKAIQKEEKRLSRREWKIAIVSAIIGGAVGLIPWIITLIGGVN